MARLEILAAWSLGAAPVLMVSLGGALEPGAPAWAGVGLAALALLPWVALLGLPRGMGGRPSEREWIVGLAMGLPVLALALRLDLSEGADPGGTAWTVGGGLALAVLMAEAARVQERTARAVHAVLWWLLVAVPPCLALALSHVARGSDGAAAWPAELCAHSPLGWMAGRALSNAPHTPALAPLTVVLVLLVAPRLALRARPRGVAR